MRAYLNLMELTSSWVLDLTCQAKASWLKKGKKGLNLKILYLKLIEVDFHQLHHVCLPESGTEIFSVPVCGSVGLQKVWQGQVGVGVLLPEEVLTAKGSDDLELRVKYTSYDNFGNPFFARFN